MIISALINSIGMSTVKPHLHDQIFVTNFISLNTFNLLWPAILMVSWVVRNRMRSVMRVNCIVYILPTIYLAFLTLNIKESRICLVFKRKNVYTLV